MWINFGGYDYGWINVNTQYDIVQNVFLINKCTQNYLMNEHVIGNIEKKYGFSTVWPDDRAVFDCAVKNYKQLLRSVFSCFQGAKNSLILF